MEDRTVKKEIIRIFRDGTVKKVNDDMLVEKRMILEVDGSREAVVIFTPGEEELWALGNLYCRHMIENFEDIRSIKKNNSRITVERANRREGWKLESRFLHTASGAFLEERRENNVIPVLPVEWQISFEALMSGIDWIAEAPLFRQTGSVHVAALVSAEGRMLFRTEDVGRHNAVDKAIGWLLKNSMKTSDAVLITSGRLPEDMVLKGAGAGIPVMASISAATADGVDTARRCNMTLIGFARDGRMNVYSAPERINFNAEQ
ncbi:MAG: formate dehydrogenase accessory sulfurtransferase FdhD [Synergistaceae bacterium]|nr:formate dehydrogenase accessory sulfurtransferase FdhD [Synergistaceae bacterium]